MSRKAWLTGLLVGWCLSWGASAWGLPRFSLWKGVGCQLCHVNPSGGGVRNVYGAEAFAAMELAAKRGGVPKAQVTQSLRLGGDLRFQPYFTADRNNQPSGDATTDTRYGFFMMQADLYASWELSNDLGVTVTQDALRGSPEVFALATFRDATSYLKVGSFLPHYGIKTDDHTAFIRGGSPRSTLPDGLLWKPKYVDAGVEAGILAAARWTVGIYNGNETGTPTPANLVDRLGPDIGATNDKAYLLRGESYIPVSGSILHIGANGYTNRNSTLEDRLTLGGVFGGMDIGPVTWMAEADAAKNVFRAASNPDKGTTALVVFTEAAYLLKKGLHLIGRFEYLDPDLDAESGRVWRGSLGLDLFPTTSLGIHPMVRYQADSRLLPNSTVAAPDMLETLVQAHWGF